MKWIINFCNFSCSTHYTGTLVFYFITHRSTRKDFLHGHLVPHVSQNALQVGLGRIYELTPFSHQTSAGTAPPQCKYSLVKEFWKKKPNQTIKRKFHISSYFCNSTSSVLWKSHLLFSGLQMSGVSGTFLPVVPLRIQVLPRPTPSMLQYTSKTPQQGTEISRKTAL